MRAAKGSGWLIRLQEKGGKQHMMPCHHALAEALHAYIAAAGIGADKKAFLFRTSRGHGGTVLADQPMTQVDAWRMVRKRALAAGIMAPIGNQDHGVSYQVIQVLLGHSKLETTALYTRIATNTIRAVMSPLDRLAPPLASLGPATAQQLAFEMLKRAANVNMTFLPYPGNESGKEFEGTLKTLVLPNSSSSRKRKGRG
jgi:hypothetical protein